MFVSKTSKGANFINGLVLFAIVVLASVVALSLVKVVRDPKNPEGFRNTLGLGRKK